MNVKLRRSKKRGIKPSTAGLIQTRVAICVEISDVEKVSG